MADSLFEVKLLGPIDVVGPSGTGVNLGSRKQRALLAILTLARGRVVAADRLIDVLWGDDPPDRAIVSLYSYVSNLRRLLEPRRDAPPSVLITVPPGYVLRLADIAVDVRRFEQASHEVSDLLEQRNWPQLRETAEQALSWWRGPALGEFAAEPFARLDAAHLEELRQVMVEDLCESRVEMNDGHVIADLDRFVSEYPLRERAWALLMRALYAGGRQSDALRTYQRARSHLLDELGVEPGPQLRELEGSILRHDDRLGVAGVDRTPSNLRAPVVELPATPSVDSEVNNATRSRLPMVGRANELQICRALLDDLNRGPRALIAEGEPGIGKTRLIEAVADLAEADGTLVVWGRSPDAHGSPAFWPWLPPLRALMELDESVHELHPGVVALLSSSPSDSRQTGETERFALFDAIVALIERVARRRHVMIVLDDLQWADVASLELTIALATRLTAPGVLLAATIRELDIGRNDVRVATLAALTRMAGSRRLKLTGLDPNDTAELLATLTKAATDPVVTNGVYDRAEGNPFFTIEIARLISDTAPLARQLGEVPHSIRDVILRRLDPMPQANIELLRIASVIGRQFDVHQLASATGHSDLMDCLETLEPAVLQRLVVHIDEHPGTYRFAHGLVRDVLLDQTPLQLAKAHLAIANALDQSDDSAEILAEHLWAAAPLADTHRTATQLERAAGVAMSRGAYEAAQHHLERAVTLYHSADPADTEGRDRTLTLLSSVSVFSRSSIARELLDHADRRSGVDDEAGRVVLRLLEFYSLNVACDFAAADPIAHELRAIAEVTADPLIRSSGYSAYGCSSWYHGRFGDAAWHLDRAVDAVERVDKVSGTGRIDAIQMHMPHVIRYHLHDLMGQLDDPVLAAQHVRNALRGDRLWSVIVADFSCLGAFMVGDQQRALREAERAIELDPDAEFARWSAAILAFRLTARCAGGDALLGRKALRRFAREKTVGTNRTTMSIIYATLALGLARHGDAADAADAATRARAEIDPHTDLYTEPLVLAAEAAVAAARPGRADEASRLLNRALAITERQGARAVSSHLREIALRLGFETMVTPDVSAC